MTLNFPLDLTDGWKIKQISRIDKSGWDFGPGLPLFAIYDEFESLTVRAHNANEAILIVAREGWPPKTLRRYNWEYQTDDRAPKEDQTS
jgi:hypothetical protein